MKKHALMLFEGVIGLILIGCQSPTTNPATEMVPSTIVFADGGSVTKLIGSGSYTNMVSGDGTGVVTYSSGTPTTATVDANSGEVTLLALGTTIISANKAATKNSTAVSSSYTLTVTVAIGMAYQGGKVAYLFQPGDQGYVAGTPHGLIAALEDLPAAGQGSYWAVVAHQTDDVPGAHGVAIGTGQSNTTAIVAQNGAGTTYAAGQCDAYVNFDTGTGIYSDWFLPSFEELGKLYLNRVAVGGFALQPYWSSSNYVSSETVRIIDFSTGQLDNYQYKNVIVTSRAVRSF